MRRKKKTESTTKKASPSRARRPLPAERSPAVGESPARTSNLPVESPPAAPAASPSFELWPAPPPRENIAPYQAWIDGGWAQWLFGAGGELGTPSPSNSGGENSPVDTVLFERTIPRFEVGKTTNGHSLWLETEMVEG